MDPYYINVIPWPLSHGKLLLCLSGWHLGSAKEMLLKLRFSVAKMIFPPDLPFSAIDMYQQGIRPEWRKRKYPRRPHPPQCWSPGPLVALSMSLLLAPCKISTLRIDLCINPGVCHTFCQHVIYDHIFLLALTSPGVNICPKNSETVYPQIWVFWNCLSWSTKKSSKLSIKIFLKLSFKTFGNKSQYF